MDRFWLKHYPEGVAHDVDPEQYGSLTDLLEAALRNQPFSVCMDQWMSCRDLTEVSGYKRLEYYQFRDELAKSNVGKILRRELRTASA